MMLPPVSLPMAKPTNPAAVAAPGPALEPERPFFEQPGIHGLSAEPDVVEGERAQAQLGDQNRAGGVQALDHGGIFGGNAIAERLGAVGGRNSGGIEKVFSAPGNSVQRAAIFPGGNFRVGFLGLREGEVGGQGDDAAEFGIVLFDSPQIDIA